MHGGTVEARSDGPGRGSEFVVRLPVAQGGRKPNVHGDDEPVGDGQAADSGRRRQSDSAMSLGMMLKLMGNERTRHDTTTTRHEPGHDAQSLGNETHTAHDGLAAVEAAEKFRPDMILLDIGLPKLNGYDACRRIREQPWSKES